MLRADLHCLDSTLLQAGIRASSCSTSWSKHQYLNTYSRTLSPKYLDATTIEKGNHTIDGEDAGCSPILSGQYPVLTERLQLSAVHGAI